MNLIAEVAERQVKETIDSLLAKPTEVPVLPQKSIKWGAATTYDVLDKLDLQK